MIVLRCSLHTADVHVCWSVCTAISWILYNLAAHPEYQARARAEVMDVLGDSDMVSWLVQTSAILCMNVRTMCSDSEHILMFIKFYVIRCC